MYGIPVPPPELLEKNIHPEIAVLPELVATATPWFTYLLLGGVAYYLFGKGGRGRYNW